MFFKTGKYKVKYQKVECEDQSKRIDMAFDMIFEELEKLMGNNLDIKLSTDVAKYHIVV